MNLLDALNMGKPFTGFTIPSDMTREEKLELIRQRMDEARLIVLPTLVIVQEWSDGTIKRSIKYDDVTPIKAYQIASAYNNRDRFYDFMCQYMVTGDKSDNIVFCCTCPYMEEIEYTTNALYATTADGLYANYLVSCDEI